MNRKEFLKYAACATAAASWKWDGVAATAGDEIIKHNAPPRNRRPYTGVDWSSALQIRTTTHGHVENQKMLDVYLKRGFEFLTISNYYPSAPRYPLKDVHEFDFRMKHDFPVTVKGKRTNGPFDWNAIVSQWKDELPEEQRKQLPFKRGRKLFKPLPPGILEAPNAEHHYFYDDARKKVMRGLHICSPGSAFQSGTFDKRDRFKTHSKGWCFGSGEPWRIAVDRIIAGLIHKDGGGITINHPTWSKLDRALILDMLDHDPRVLGMEVLEAGRNSEHYWDWALSTGRQCFGFFVPDWSLNNKIFGANVLCVKERTVHACLKAYREGNFYGAAHGLNELAFTHLSFDGKCVKASTDKPARFEVVTAQGVVKTVEGKNVTWDVVPDGSGTGPRVDVFARIRATAADGCGEVLYSQPFMLV